MSDRTSISLGIMPAGLTVVLTDAADFTYALRKTIGGVPADWDAGTVLTLVTATTSWAATIVGSLATWNVDKAVTGAVADGVAVRLVYTNGSIDQVWASGTVVRRG